VKLSEFAEQTNRRLRNIERLLEERLVDPKAHNPNDTKHWNDCDWEDEILRRAAEGREQADAHRSALLKTKEDNRGLIFGGDYCKIGKTWPVFSPDGTTTYYSSILDEYCLSRLVVSEFEDQIDLTNYHYAFKYRNRGN